MPLVPGIGGKPRVILGLMTFGPDAQANARVTSLDEFNKCLDVFQARGYNEVDTARVYVAGKQEAFTRDAKWKERGLTLATKVYPLEPGAHKPEALREKFEMSLKELGTDCVDIFYLHAADRSVPFEETLREVNKFHQEGRFVRFGISNYTSFELAEAVMICRANGWVRPTIYQGVYNAVQRSIERELIPACRRYGLDIVIYNPIAGGLFSGKYTADSLREKPKEGRFSGDARVGTMYRARYFKEATFDALELIEQAAKKHGLTMLETAMRWIVHHSQLKINDGNDGIIIGVSSLAQIDGNIENAEKGPLPDDLVEVLDQAWRIAQPAASHYTHGEMKYTYDTVNALFGPNA